MKDLGGKMGGRDVEVVVVDDELKPDAAVTKVKGLLERDKVDFVVGPIFSTFFRQFTGPSRNRRPSDQPQCGSVNLCRQGL